MPFQVIKKVGLRYIRFSNDFFFQTLIAAIITNSVIYLQGLKSMIKKNKLY